MKTAILISGHLRTFRETLPSFKRFLLRKFPFDIFIATYDIEDNCHPTWWRKTTRSSKRRVTNINEIQRVYNPRNIIIKKSEHPKQCPHDNFTKFPTMSLDCSITIVLEAYQLAAKHQKYERFISIRPDLEFFTEFRKDEIDNQSVTYFPRQDFFTSLGGICDTWVITNSYYMNCLNEYKQQVLPKLFNSKSYIPHHELLLNEFLRKKRIDIALSSTKWGLRRSEKTVQIWDQSMPFYEGGNVASFLIKRALNYILRINKNVSDTKILFRFKIGHEIHPQKPARNTVKRKRHYKKSNTPNWLPRFRAGKLFFEVFLKRSD